MKLIKLLLSILVLMGITACSQQKTDSSLYAEFQQAYDKVGTLTNYHNDAQSLLVIDDELEYKVSTASDYDDGQAMISSTTYIDGENMGTSSIYIVDGNIYYDNLDGSKTYTTFTSDLSNMNDLYFTIEDISSITKNGDKLNIVLNEETCANILNQNGLDVTKVNKLTNELIIEISEDTLRSQHLTIDYTINSGNIEYSGKYEYESSYVDIGQTSLKLPEDYSLYINLDDLKENMTLEEFKYALIEQLGYAIDDYGQYVLDFNGNESYIFDFNNYLFTYIKGQSAYTYNWQSNVGGYNACTYDFSNAQSLGTCSETELTKIEEAKVSYLAELSFVGINEMPKD